VNLSAGPPGSAVLTAYGLTGSPVPLPGGQGTSWRVGRAVLKPQDMDPAVLPWHAGVLARLRGRTDFRVSEPLPTTDNRWTVGGWTAWRYEAGAHSPGRWHDIVAVGRRLHSALVDEPEPGFLAERTDRWAVGDRVAWGDLPATDFARSRSVSALVEALRPVALRRQLVHGDLTGNVLFDDDLPPLVIDLSPYWRPPEFATAVVVADALVFEGAGEEVAEPFLHEPSFPQCLVRALIFRAVSDQLGAPNVPQDDVFASAARTAVRWASSVLG
jgi:uncharacterized protein (TIGR02569 family)